MLKILIFCGAPEASEAELGEQGYSESNEILCIGGIRSVAPNTEFCSLHVADGEQLPQGISIEDFDGVSITGSPLNSYHRDDSRVRVQIELARTIFNKAIPMFGSCWGMQIMAAAFDGDTELNKRGREVGIARSILPKDHGIGHPLFRGKGKVFDALCIHEDVVNSLPSNGFVLASNANSPIQALEMVDGSKSFWGVQYHPEFTFGRLAALIHARRKRHISEGLARTNEEVDRIVADFRSMHLDPNSKGVPWIYGLKSDVIDPLIRRAEFRNWIDTKVRAFASRKA